MRRNVKYKRTDALSLWHQQYIGSVTATTHQGKGKIAPESNPSRGTVLQAPNGKGNKCDKNIKYKRTDALSLWHKHYIGYATATTHQEKGIIILESNPSRGTVLPAPRGKGNNCDKNVKYKRNDALSLLHQHYIGSVTATIHQDKGIITLESHHLP